MQPAEQASGAADDKGSNAKGRQSGRGDSEEQLPNNQMTRSPIPSSSLPGGQFAAQGGSDRAETVSAEAQTLKIRPNSQRRRAKGGRSKVVAIGEPPDYGPAPKASGESLGGSSEAALPAKSAAGNSNSLAGQLMTLMLFCTEHAQSMGKTSPYYLP